MKKNIITVNKKAKFNYSFIDEYIAGIVLTGTEIKSIRNKKASINDAYCYFIKNELFIKQMHIAQYIFGNIYNHDEYRNRKLLLNRNELIKIKNSLNTGVTIIPKELFINEKGIAKITICLAKGKKQYDKRNAIKEREIMRKINEKQNNY